MREYHNEDGMELPPLRNRESLPPEDKIEVSKLKYKIAIWSAVLSFLGLVITSLIPLFTTVFANEQKQILKDAEQQTKVQKVIDSIKAVEEQKELQQAFKDIASIYELLNRLNRLIPNASGIAIYSTHDSGGVPRSGSPLHATVLYQTGKGEGMGKEYWQKRVIPEGYFYFNKRVYENGEYYIPNVEDAPAVYNGVTKEDIDFNDVKSMYGYLIKTTPKENFYIAVSFSTTNPIQYESPNLKNIIRQYSSRFHKLLK